MFRFHCLRRKERNGSSSLKVTVVHNDSAFDASVVPDLCLSSVNSVNATLMETVFFFFFFLGYKIFGEEQLELKCVG